MKHKPLLQEGCYYHIFNRGIDGCALFKHNLDYRHFIELSKIFIVPIADVLSYALLNNHFHFVIRIKNQQKIGWLIPENRYAYDLSIKWETTFDVADDEKSLRTRPNATKMIGHMMSAYAKWFNAKYERTGRLLEERFERKPILTLDHLKQEIIYVNRNPIKHGVSKSLDGYPWTSFKEIISSDSTWISRDMVINQFGDLETFILAIKKIDLDDWFREG